ncbi:hypothetical protein E0K89_005965 [Aquicoccus sp. SCR17]|nr:hypothetical protein [Carideicomes alvinocaridis]
MVRPPLRPILFSLLVPLGAGPALSQEAAEEGLYLQEVLREEEPPILRYRYVMPGLDKLDTQQALDEIARICTEDVAPFLKGADREAQIVISLSEAQTPFGEHAPAIRQHFDAFRLENDRCIWEMF